MRTRLSGILAMAGIALITLPGCVSSKKYKASQATLQRVRDDSARLAQQASACNASLQTAQDQNASLQKSLDKSTADYTAQQAKLETYNGYFSKQQEAMGRVTQELKDSLQSTGLTESDLEQSNGMLYVNLDENTLFKKNSTMVSKQGKQMIAGLATVLKSHDDINVGVDNGYTASGNMASSSAGTGSTSDNMSSASAAPARKHHYAAKRRAASSATSGSTASSGTGTTQSSTATQGSTASAKSATPHKHAARNYSKESSAAWASGMTGKQKSAWMLKAARVNTVAGSLLKEGIPRVAIIAQRPPTDGSADNGKIRVIVTHTAGEAPQTGSSTTPASTGTTASSTNK
jgi:outer membrane protein OmpA-like peptidoglycan-associated protein